MLIMYKLDRTSWCTSRTEKFFCGDKWRSPRIQWYRPRTRRLYPHSENPRRNTIARSCDQCASHVTLPPRGPAATLHCHERPSTLDRKNCSRCWHSSRQSPTPNKNRQHPKKTKLSWPTSRPGQQTRAEKHKTSNPKQATNKIKLKVVQPTISKSFHPGWNLSWGSFSFLCLKKNKG